jgi:hypothetical protein
MARGGTGRRRRGATATQAYDDEAMEEEVSLFRQVYVISLICFAIHLLCYDAFVLLYICFMYWLSMFLLVRSAR